MAEPGGSERLDIVPLTPGDHAAFVAHMERHGAESGTGGDPTFMPDPGRPWGDKLATWPELLARPLTEPGWRRYWGVYDPRVRLGSPRIVAHLDLIGGTHPALLHRATLGIGIERPFRRRGLGRRLLATVEAFAAEQGLAWLDARVFAHNAASLGLFDAAGYQRLVRVADALRVGGEPVGDWMFCKPISR